MQPYELLLEQSMEELRLKTTAHDSLWHLAEADWSVDQQLGEIVFTARGIQVTAPVQVIGSYDATEGTWMWGWANSSIHAPLTQHALKVKAYGEQMGIPDLTFETLECDELKAWEYTALATKLNNTQGAYRGPAGSTYVFMTFGDVTLEGQK